MGLSANRSWTSESDGVMICAAVPLLPRARPESGLISRRFGAFSFKPSSQEPREATCATATVTNARPAAFAWPRNSESGRGRFRPEVAGLATRGHAAGV
jgi:hypothetical protein